MVNRFPRVTQLPRTKAENQTQVKAKPQPPQESHPSAWVLGRSSMV